MRFPHARTGRRVGFFTTLVSMIVNVAPQAFGASPGETLRKYLDARLRGDLATAEALWGKDDLRRSQGLGIFYAPLEATYDDNLLLSADERTALAVASRAVVRDSVVEAGFARYTVLLTPRTASNATDTLTYSVRAAGETWSVTSPYAKRTAAWTSREGRYVRLRSSKLRNVNRHALAALDNGVAAMFERLQTPDVARLRLERIKIEYYLCADDAEVQMLTGNRAPSQFQLAGARVVTRSPADLNAVARAVVHLTLRDAPPFAAPVLEQGLAAALGGGDGWSAGVTLQSGAAQVARDATLPADDALHAGARESVCAAATWADALLKNLGAARFLDLYRGLSGSGSQVRARDAATVRKAIETATGKRGADLDTVVREHARAFVPPIAAGCITWPEETQSLRPQIRWRDMDEKWALDVFEIGNEYVATLSPYLGPVPPWAQRMMDSLQSGGKKPAAPKPVARPAGDPPQLALLFRERLVAEPDAFESPLYASHFASRRYAGDLVGLIIRPDGVEMWDYRRGVLIGKVAADLALPADGTYYDKPTGRISFRIQPGLVPAPLLEHVAVCTSYTGE